MKTPVSIVLVGVLLAGCGDPLRGVDRLADVELAEEKTSIELRADPAAASEETGAGFLSRMFGRSQPGTVKAELAEQPATADVPETPEAEIVAPQADADQDSEHANEAENPKKPLFGFLRAKPADTEAEVVAEPVKNPSEPEQAKAVVVVAKPDEASQTEKSPSAVKKRGGMFSGLRVAGKKGPQPGDVAPGTVLPYGAVGRVCDLPKSKLGKEISRFPERGRGYRIFDSAPGSTAQHTFYVTGFDDGCARQFTAALAMFGSPTLHEQLRYGLPSSVQPYSATDKAYETVKSKVCRVGRKKPCGAKISTLEKNTAFVSIYERFSGSARWANILLHDGKVVARDMKGG